MEPVKIDLTLMNQAVRDIGIAAQKAIAALSSPAFLAKLYEAQALLEKQREEERWRNDPLELKDKLVDTMHYIRRFWADVLRTIADIIDP